jgi:ComF family protein
LKYRGDLGLGEALSRPLVDYFKELGWQVDLVSPVPISRERLTRRGYNQSALIAFPFALATRLAYRPGSLTRLHDTPTQVGLSAEARKLNLAGAFRAQIVRGARVLVIDDVTTTGATLHEASKVLREAGASAIYCLTVARSLKKKGSARIGN